VAETFFLLRNLTERSQSECGRESEEAASSTLYLQLQLSRASGLVAWHSEMREHSGKTVL
jgi:hypothetical protein